MKRSAARLGGFIWQHLLPVTLTLLFLLPLFFMFSTSLRVPGLPPARTVELIPQPLTFANYTRIFSMLPFGRYLLNSVLVATTGTVLTLLVASWAGLGMALLGPRARFHLLALAALLQMIPIASLWLTRFIIFARLGITNSYITLLAPALMGTSPILVLLFYWTFRRVNRAIFESAEMDGAHILQLWWHMALPLARPALMAAGMLAFLYYWNDFINPLLYLHSQTLFTLPLGLLQLQVMDKTDWPLLMAGAVVMTLPAIAVFALLQRTLLWWELE